MLTHSKQILNWDVIDEGFESQHPLSTEPLMCLLCAHLLTWTYNSLEGIVVAQSGENFQPNKANFPRTPQNANWDVDTF